jgi:hypothetical protein
MGHLPKPSSMLGPIIRFLACYKGGAALSDAAPVQIANKGKPARAEGFPRSMIVQARPAVVKRD